jgi:hypothetical protein
MALLRLECTIIQSSQLPAGTQWLNLSVNQFWLLGFYYFEFEEST